MTDDEPEEMEKTKVMYPKGANKRESPSPTPSDEYNPEMVTPAPTAPGFTNAAPPPPYYGYHGRVGTQPPPQQKTWAQPPSGEDYKKAWADYYARCGEYYKQYYAAGGYYTPQHMGAAQPIPSSAPAPAPAPPPTGGVARKLGDAEPSPSKASQDTYVPMPITVSPQKKPLDLPPSSYSARPVTSTLKPSPTPTPAYSSYARVKPASLIVPQNPVPRPKVPPRDPAQVKFLVTEWVTKCIDLAKDKPAAVRTAVENAVRKEMPPQSHWGRIDWVNKSIPEGVIQAAKSSGEQRKRRDYSSDSERRRRGRRHNRRHSSSSSSSSDDRRQKKRPAQPGVRIVPSKVIPNKEGIQFTRCGSPPKGREFTAKEHPVRSPGQLPRLRDVRIPKEKRKRRKSSRSLSSSSSSTSSSSSVVRRHPRGVLDIPPPQPNSYAVHVAAGASRFRAKDKRIEKQQKLQHQFASLDQLGKRENRLARFDKPGNKKTFTKMTPLAMPTNLSGGISKATGLEFAEEECAPIIGVCEDLEKTFTRSAAGLEHDPRDVRPEHVLRKSLKHICEVRLRKEGDDQRIYCYEQFKSLRQDLTVQHIYTSFTTDVYETHARICLEHGDLGEFNACQAKLRAYHKRSDMIVSPDNVIEFTAYRILYCALTKSHADLAAEMENLSASDRQSPVITHALSIITALTPVSAYLLDKVYNDAPNLGALLIDLFLPPPRGLRMQMYLQLLKAYRPGVPFNFMKQSLLFAEEDDPNEIISEKSPDPSTFRGFLAYAKAVVKGNTIDSMGSLTGFNSVQAYLDERQDFNGETPSPTPTA
eukprot:TRINITY_DN9388_c0_g2_i1.p1 TRINITY_DN9388_c0_g2~~TRINITY_DN9388_c0_g2_i1.p1  ORF type:complete len:811 (+),score=138.32 TRINITY_DN9388_c0_g2_i1:74-2506(+)